MLVMYKGIVGKIKICVLALVISAIYFATASAETQVGNRYQFENPAIGFDGSYNSVSTNFQTLQAVGGDAVGNSSSTSFQVQAGARTTPDPTLSFAVLAFNSTFGSFSPTATATTTSTFSVVDYTSYGYAVQIIGTPPTNGAHIITPISATSASTIGSEQFGINLVANTAPAIFGANPNNGSFGFGTAATNYNTVNNYRYVSGETIAIAPKSSGTTIYTISYIVNVSSITPGGDYSSNQSIICTATY